MTSNAPVLEMRGITKSFAGNTVLSDVSLSAAAGEVHSLVGENGAGKSTLMKILAGVHRTDSGEIFIEGDPVRFARPADALEHGIAMIYQELSLAPHLTVAENIFLGREPLRLAYLKIINSREMNARAASLLSDNGFDLDPRKRVSQLSAADRQLVEITRATVEARRVIVMDEPTSSLTTREVEELFRLMRDLKARGLAIIYISHRLEELESIAARKPKVVIPGHLAEGAPIDGSTITYTRDYLLAFEEEVAKAKDSTALIDAMKTRYLTAGMDVALDLGAKVAMGELKWG